MTRWIRFVLGMLVLLCSVALLSCKRKREGLVLGLYAPMTGSQAEFGVSTRNGVQMAIDETNAKGGILGQKIRLVVEDTRGETSEAASAVTRLIDREGVVGILGDIASRLSLAGGRIAQSRHIPMITPSSTNADVTEIGDYVFRVCFIDPFQGMVMARFAYEGLGARKIAIFKDETNAYSTGLADAFRRTFVSLGGTIVAEESYHENDTHFSAQLGTILATGPEHVFVPGYFNEVALIAREARGLGFTGKFLGGDGWDGDALYKNDADTLVGSYFSESFSPDHPVTPTGEHFVAAYRTKFNTEANGMSALGYDAALVMIDSIRKAGSLDPPRIRDVIAHTTAFPGATGNITLDEKRNALKSAVILEVKPNGFGYFQAMDGTVVASGPSASDGSKGSSAGPTTKTSFLNQFFEGISLGGVYALLALGYTMVYGVLGLINFAHSDVFMLGAYGGVFTAQIFGITTASKQGGGTGVFLLCVLLSMIMCAMLGMAIERLAYRPVRNAPKLTPLVTAIGVSMLLQNIAVLLFTSNPRGFPPLVMEETWHIGPITTKNIKVLNLGAAVVLMLALTALVQRTRVGKAMRAISTNLDAARLMGVPTDRIISLTFGLGSALAGAGGILFALDQPKVEPLMGVQPGLKAFVAAVLGGIGNIPGAMVGGLVIGVVEQLTGAYVSSSFAPAIVFSILVIVLLVRPQGLLGKVTREKV